MRKTIPPELEGEYIIRVVDMPVASKGFVTYDEDDFANVYINAHYNDATRHEAADHEIEHIINDDIHNSDDISTAEARAESRRSRLKAIPHLMKARDLLPKPVQRKRPPAREELRPHQRAVVMRAIAALDSVLRYDRYEY